MQPKLPSRIPFEEMTPALQELLTPKRERLGYVGEFFQVGAVLECMFGYQDLAVLRRQ